MDTEYTQMEWLLAGDPAIRWQTLRDLNGAGRTVVERERGRVTREGWGARLLALQTADGQWGGGIYNPKWISTTYTLLLLRSFGLAPGHPAALEACSLMLDRGLYEDGGINFFTRRYGYSEACITGMTLAAAAYFELDDKRVETMVSHLLARQMADGGWNCCDRRGATHGSFHTTIIVLEALRDYENFGPGATGRVRAAQGRGREFLLAHHLFRSHRTGAVVKPEMIRFSFPPRWHYDILRALDYFRECGAARDERLAEAIEIVERRRQPDGRWLLQNTYPGKVFFAMEETGKPSRWNTLRALRVLKWWNGAKPGGRGPGTGVGEQREPPAVLRRRSVPRKS